MISTEVPQQRDKNSHVRRGVAPKNGGMFQQLRSLVRMTSRKGERVGSLIGEYGNEWLTHTISVALTFSYQKSCSPLALDHSGSNQEQRKTTKDFLIMVKKQNGATKQDADDIQAYTNDLEIMS